MAEALSIQMRLLPAELPQVPGYSIAADWRPARIVGGDYYDVLRFDENTLGFCIADVAGKGMPAALLMSNLQAAVRGLASPSGGARRIVRRHQPATMPQHRRRPLHHFFLRECSIFPADSCASRMPDIRRH